MDVVIAIFVIASAIAFWAVAIWAAFAFGPWWIGALIVLAGLCVFGTALLEVIG